MALMALARRRGRCLGSAPHIPTAVTEIAKEVPHGGPPHWRGSYNPGLRVAPDAVCDVTPVRVLLGAFEELREEAAEEGVLPTPVAQRRPRKWKAKAGDLCTVFAVPQREGKWGYACSACCWVSCGAACKKRDFDTHLCGKPRLSAAAVRAANAPPPAPVVPI